MLSERTFFVELTGNSTNEDFSNNTYYFAHDSCDVSWQVIRDLFQKAGSTLFVFLTVMSQELLLAINYF